MKNVDNMQTPLVSIIITSYNRAHSIEAAIRSSLEQTYHNIEIIISDNCSTDNSMEIINQYGDDPRVRIFRNDTNIGMIPNFRKATEELAKGEFITYVSSDDRLTDKEFIAKSMELAAKYSNVVLIFGKLRQVSTDGTILGETNEFPFWQSEFLEGKDVFLRYVENSWLSWGGCILNKKELNIMEPFEDYHSGKDIEINLKLLLKGNACFINSFCYEQGIHFKNASLSSDVANRMLVAKKIFDETHAEAVKLYPGEQAQFDKWRQHVLQTYFKQTLIILKIDKPKEFREMLSEVKQKYPVVYAGINKDIRWKLMNKMYHPALFPLLKLLSPKRYQYFKQKLKGVS